MSFVNRDRDTYRPKWSTDKAVPKETVIHRGRVYLLLILKELRVIPGAYELGHMKRQSCRYDNNANETEWWVPNIRSQYLIHLPALLTRTFPCIQCTLRSELHIVCEVVEEYR